MLRQHIEKLSIFIMGSLLVMSEPTQKPYIPKTYHAFTSKGTMDDLIKVLNDHYVSDEVVYIEPMIWQTGQIIEYGYRFIIKVTK